MCDKCGTSDLIVGEGFLAQEYLEMERRICRKMRETAKEDEEEMLSLLDKIFGRDRR